MLKIWSPASKSVILTKSFIPGYNLTKSSETKSCSAAANSTPVGPPPTIAKWRILFFSSSLTLGKHALSKQSMTVLLIFCASSTSWTVQTHVHKITKSHKCHLIKRYPPQNFSFFPFREKNYTKIHANMMHNNDVKNEVTFKKWQFSVTPGVLNVLTFAPTAMIR